MSIMEMELRRREKAHTYWLHVVTDEGGIPLDVLEDLAQIRWSPDSYRNPKFPASSPEWIEKWGGYPFPTIHLTVKGPPGDKIFGAWSPEQAKLFLHALRRVLRHHGLKAPVRVMRIEDML